MKKTFGKIFLGLTALLLVGCGSGSKENSNKT